MNKNELKEGEIYNYKIYNHTYIIKLNIKNNNPKFKNGFGGKYVFESSINKKFAKERTIHYLDKGVFTKATPEEKHWLNSCIDADKFISYEEAMKSFIPEYVECIKLFRHDWKFTINKIYKWPQPIDNVGKKHLAINTYKSWIKYFKPSTKEAYDAQFRKEVIKVKPFDIVSVIGRFGNELFLNKDEYYRNKDKTISVYIRANDLDNYKINSVINEEGNIFMIGDIITPSIVESPNKGKGFKIIGFRLNVDKSMICAITDTHTPYGIGIDKIEHFIEKDEFVLPEKWYIKLTLENIEIIGNWFKINKHPKSSTDYHCLDVRTNTKPRYETIHYPAIENRWGYYHGSFRSTDYIEITFDQFKKYVLKEENKSNLEIHNEKVLSILPLQSERRSAVITESHVDQLRLKEVEIDSIVIPNETLLEKAKRLYPIGTKIKSAISNYTGTIIEFPKEPLNSNNNIVVNVNNSNSPSNMIYLYKYNRWATIIEDKPKVGDKFTIPTKSTSYNNNITFNENSIFKIHSIENNIVKFIGGYDTIETVLLKNIKIVK